MNLQSLLTSVETRGIGAWTNALKEHERAVAIRMNNVLRHPEYAHFDDEQKRRAAMLYATEPHKYKSVRALERAIGYTHHHRK